MSLDFQRSLSSYETGSSSSWYERIHVDPILLLLITGVVLFGLVILSSAVDGKDALFEAQVRRIGLAYAALIIAAQLPPAIYLRWAPFLYVVGLVLLILVLFVGVKVKGSQRWIDIPGLFRFQPSELMKIAVPMAVAWYLQQRVLPPSFKHTAFSLLIIGVPAVLIGVEPDLGTSILVAGAGVAVLLLAGLSWRWIFGAFALIAAAAPLLWQFVLKDYQRQRILTLFDPQSDPLGAGWNIIQSTTAIGSGGVFGKGLYQGSQSYLDFLPEAKYSALIPLLSSGINAEYWSRRRRLCKIIWKTRCCFSYFRTRCNKCCNCINRCLYGLSSFSLYFRTSTNTFNWNRCISRM